jgi:S1-C subfamily serine protease
VQRNRSLDRGAGLVAAAVIGGGIALGGAAILGGIGSNTTTVREIAAPAPTGQNAFVTSSGSRLSISQVYQRDAPGVVQVTSTTVVNVQSDPLFPWFSQPEQQQALGSGFVLDKAGHIVTNYHVVRGARSVRVSFSNNDSLKATIVGADPSTDIAVLKVDASSRALTPLALGNSDRIQVGDPVAAIGNPFGLERTVTAGIVSALQRQITAPNGYTIDHVIQTDAAINHGNSGGPLLDVHGRVIGVNSQIETGSSATGNVGIGFAVPSNTVKAVVAQLIRSGKVERAFIGISAAPLTASLSKLFHLGATQGLLVQRVQPGSGAAKGGLKAGSTKVVVAGESYLLGGDIILRADGVTVGSIDRLRDAVAARKPGDALKLTVLRNGRKVELSVTLGKQPTVT